MLLTYPESENDFRFVMENFGNPPVEGRQLIINKSHHTNAQF